MPEPKPRKAILYCRVSTNQQGEQGTSLAAQYIACLKKAEELGREVTRHVEENDMKKWILFGLLAACSAVSAVYAGELAELHGKTIGSTQPKLDKSRSHEEVRDQKHGITEIGLERTRCKGTCPAYTVVIQSDGTLRYRGEAFVKKTGGHTGKVNMGRFNELAQFIKDAGYMDLENTYHRSVTDHPTVYTTVMMNAKRKVIKNYANSGPTKLWAIEQLIDKLMLEAQWDDEQPPNKTTEATPQGF